MASEKLSARQLSVAVMVGGLSTGASVAGEMDWRWGLLAVAFVLLVGGLLLKQVGSKPLFQGVSGGVLAALYCGWGVIIMAAVLRGAAQRFQNSVGNGVNLFWPLLALTLPLLWMGWGKAAAFFRAVEIFWLAMTVVLAVILVLGFARVDWRYLWEPGGNWQESVAAMGSVLSVGLFVLPYIYKVELRPGDARRGLNWLGMLGVVSAALSAVTVGLLSPAVAAQVTREPFFITAGLLGNSSRMEGLISIIWLLPDLTLAGLLSRVWGAQRWPAAAVLLASAVALTGITEFLSPPILACGSLILALLVVILPKGDGKIVVKF